MRLEGWGRPQKVHFLVGQERNFGLNLKGNREIFCSFEQGSDLGREEC